MVGSCCSLTPLKSSGLRGAFGSASMLLKIRDSPPFCLSEIGAARPFPRAAIAHHRRTSWVDMVGRLLILPSVISGDLRLQGWVFSPLVFSSDLGQQNTQCGQCETQFSKVGKSPNLCACRWICMLALNLMLWKAVEKAWIDLVPVQPSILG